MLNFKNFKHNEIPSSPGIYVFRLDLVSQSKLCLRGSTGHAEIEVVRAKKNLIKRIQLIDKVMSSRKFEGQISEIEKVTHNKIQIDLLGNSRRVFEGTDLIKKLEEVEQLISLIQILEIITKIIPPLYVGIALEQTLKDRYEQHWNNYLSKKENGFGGRLSKSGLGWDDLSYSAIEIPTGIIQKDLVEVCEDLFQGFSKPIFSIK